MGQTRYTIQYFRAKSLLPLEWEWLETAKTSQVYNDLDEANKVAEFLVGRHSKKSDFIHENRTYGQRNNGRKQWITANSGDISKISGTTVVFKAEDPTESPIPNIPKTLVQRMEDLDAKWRWPKAEAHTPGHGGKEPPERRMSEGDKPDRLTLLAVDEEVSDNEDATPDVPTVHEPRLGAQKRSYSEREKPSS
jgi:hypothetical protein